MKRVVGLLCAGIFTVLMFVGCGAAAPRRFQYTYTDLFDTVTTFALYSTKQEQADAWAAALYERLLLFHRQYSIYEDFDGVNNLKTVNDRAGQPVEVSDDLFNLLELCVKSYSLSDKKVNVAMGSVLQLWHTAREQGLREPAAAALPAEEALRAAAQHCAIENVQLDAAAKTVRLADTAMSLDVGAVAKGYATARLAEYAAQCGMTDAIISVGGNVVTVGDKYGQHFVIGIEDPQGKEPYALRVRADNAAVVTSGSYQRYFTVNGKRYHHLIDPDTLYPADFCASVTVIGADAGMADMLSTTLFLMPPEQGKKLLATVDGYEAVWILQDGTQIFSEKFEKYREL